MSNKRGSKTITGEDELEVDIINIIGDEGLEIKDYAGTNGDVLQKSAVTNELIWDVVPPPGDNSITSNMFTENCVNNRALGTDAVESINIQDNAVTINKIGDRTITGVKIGQREISGTEIALDTILDENIADSAVTTNKINDSAVTTNKINDSAVNTNKLNDGAVTNDKIDNYTIQTNKLSPNINYDTTGTIQTRDPNLAVVTFAANISVAGKTAGKGSTAIGSLKQIGLVIDDPPTTGTYKKGLIYANSFESIIPDNSGTGWLPLQVKTSAGAAGDRFSIDIDGNMFIKGNFSGDPISKATQLNMKFNSTTNLFGRIDFEAVGTQTYLKGSDYPSQPTEITYMKMNSTTNLFGRIDFEAIGNPTYLKGSNYPSQPTIATYLDLTSNTNILPKPLPYRCYNESGQVYLAINSADWRPNDDHTYFNVNIVDSDTNRRGRAQVDIATLEMVAMVLIPDGWEATHFKVYADSSREVKAYVVFNDNTQGSTDLTLYQGTTKYTNTEHEFVLNNVSYKAAGDKDRSVMIVVMPTSTSDYISGGYLKIQEIVVGGD
jgi:hypothetical protein